MLQQRLIILSICLQSTAQPQLVLPVGNVLHASICHLPLAVAAVAAIGKLPPNPIIQARQSLTEQHKLMAEKNALIETVKRLNREVAKLEHFKRNLLQQLQDDNEVWGNSCCDVSRGLLGVQESRLLFGCTHKPAACACLFVCC